MYDVYPLTGPSNEDAECFGLNGSTGVAGVIFKPGLVGTTWSGAAPPNFTMGANSESVLYAINDAGSAVGLKGFNNTPTQRAVFVSGGVSRSERSACNRPASPSSSPNGALPRRAMSC